MWNEATLLLWTPLVLGVMRDLLLIACALKFLNVISGTKTGLIALVSSISKSYGRAPVKTRDRRQ